jgi:soluble lytic murein transglycosylase-like protein
VIPAGIAEVTARIAQIEQRFGVPQPFPADLAAKARGAAAGPPPASPAWTAPAAPPAAAPAAAGAPAAPGWASAAGVQASSAVASVGGDPAAGSWAQRLPAAGQRWAGAIEQAAGRAGIAPALLGALVQAESAFRADARSHAGAIGLGQLMPGTARELGVDPHDPQQNLDGAARYLRAQLDRFGSVELALAAYNAGPGRVARAGGVPRITETQQYVQRVTANYQHLRSA